MIDSAIVKIAAGKGGDGLASFRHEKYVPRGGPDGGDGGDGGDVILKVDPQLSTLSDYARVKEIKAEPGFNGQKQRKHGKAGEDLTIFVPLGTIVSQIIADEVTKIADITQPDFKLVLAHGGKGGWGNCHFATSTNQAPKQANAGLAGDAKTIQLDLKLLADVGLIGLPNVGKSTLISLISSARPKIADYLFTTLEPNLGKVDYKGKSFVVADIPGLIEGASQGKGLGDQFLRHIERTKIIIHLVAADSLDLEKDYEVIINELKLSHRDLMDKPQIVVVSRYDLCTDKTQVKKFITKHKALTLSQTDRTTLTPILNKTIELLG